LLPPERISLICFPGLCPGHPAVLTRNQSQIKENPFIIKFNQHLCHLCTLLIKHSDGRRKMLQLANIQTSETPTSYYIIYTLELCPRHPARTYIVTILLYIYIHTPEAKVALQYYYNMFFDRFPSSLSASCRSGAERET